MASLHGSSDVAVVGGGLIGCAIALRLVQQKVRVTVFERGEPGCEASTAGAGMIAPQGETAQPDLFYELCAASRDLYPDFLAEVEEISGKRVDFHVHGTLMVAMDETERARLEGVFEGQTQCGLSLEKLTSEELRKRNPHLSSRVLAGVFVAGDHWLDNEMLVAALRAACQRCGVVFRLHNEATRFNAGDSRVESIEAREPDSAVTTRYSAGSFVLAAGAWSGSLAKSLNVRLPVAPCRGQMMEFDGSEDFPLAVRAGHCYAVSRSGGRIIAGSTMEYAGFEKSVTGEGLISILEGASRFLPLIKRLRFRRAWAGLRPDTEDHRPVLGYERFQNLVFATGHFRNGILLTPVTAKLITELLLTGSTSIPIDAYSPQRFHS